MKRRTESTRDVVGSKQPLSGWIRYMNDRRVDIRLENPDLSFSEITKLLAEEWSQLPRDQKQQYLGLAEQEHTQYLEEMTAYKQTESYRMLNERKAKIMKIENNIEFDPQLSAFEIPIFTEEFLSFNTARETELRQLRKTTVDLERENSILCKHVETLQMTIEKLEEENVKRCQSNNLLKMHLQKLREKLVDKLAEIPLPCNELPTIENIDCYIEQLYSLVQDKSQMTLINKLKDILADVDIVF